MADLSMAELQLRQRAWSRRNFPNQKNYQCILGLVEEVGELAHAHLKLEQGIRLEENLEDKRKDAVGDIVIFLAGYCNGVNISLSECVSKAWEEVSKRDWSDKGE